MTDIGRKVWAIAEGFIPGSGISDDPALMSHESACLLNPNDRDAMVKITVFFSHRDPLGAYVVTVAA